MSVTLRLLSGAGRACWFYHQCPVKVEGDAGAAPACAVLQTAGCADHPIACGGSEGSCTPGGAFARRLKRPNRSLLREPIPGSGAAPGSRTPSPSLATKRSAVKPVPQFLHAALGFVLADHAGGNGPDGEQPAVSGQGAAVKNGRPCGCRPRSCALKGRRPSW